MSEFPFPVVSDEEAEQCAAVACARDVGQVTPFDDNEKGICSLCNHPIIFRPYVPKTPPKICLECILEMHAAERH